MNANYTPLPGHRSRPEDAVLCMIDLQERLLPVIPRAAMILQECHCWLEVAKRLQVPVLFSEQYPRGLGPTVSELLAIDLGSLGLGRFSKTSFSAYAQADWRDALAATGRRTAVLIGVDTHICIQQTAIDLLEFGYTVELDTTATGSRQETHHDMACRRLAQAGARLTTTESLVFEWLADAQHPEFKPISQGLKSRGLKT